MAETHPIVATLFVGLVGSLIVNGALGAVEHQREEAVRVAEARAKDRRDNIALAVARGEEGDYEGAAALLNEVLQEDPSDPDALYNMGIAVAAMGRTDDAEKIFSSILAKSPSDWDATAELAGIYDAKADGERAMQLLEKIPPGAANLTARLGDASHWMAVRRHERWPTLSTKHSVSTSTTTPE